MKSLCRALAVFLLSLGVSLQGSFAQDCRPLLRGEIKLLPSLVPLELEVIPVVAGKAMAIEFSDKTQIVVAPLDTGSYRREVQEKYQ